jgi:hypothetical protein
MIGLAHASVARDQGDVVPLVQRGVGVTDDLTQQTPYAIAGHRGAQVFTRDEPIAIMGESVGHNTEQHEGVAPDFAGIPQVTKILTSAKAQRALHGGGMTGRLSSSS